MTDEAENSRAVGVIALLMLIVGSAAALITVLGLLRGHQSVPGEFAIALCFLPYVAGALILQITRKGRVAIAVALIPAIADVIFAMALGFGTTPTWKDELTWRAVRSTVTLIAVPICLGVSLWFERVDHRQR